MAWSSMAAHVRAEQHQEVGGRDARMVEFAGLRTARPPSPPEARLDAVLHAASAVDYSAALSIRPGRRLMVRRAAFRRGSARQSRGGVYAEAEARDPSRRRSDHGSRMADRRFARRARRRQRGTAFALPDPPDRRRDPDPARRQRRRTLSRVRRHRARSSVLEVDAVGRKSRSTARMSPCAGRFPRIQPAEPS